VTTAGRSAYFFIMTLAFGGDAWRSTYGYALKPCLLVMIHRVFTLVVFSCMCLVAGANLYRLMIGTAPNMVTASCFSGPTYNQVQFGMACVEIGGSLVWFIESHKEVGKWGLVGASANVAGWLLIKFEPPLLVHFGVQDRTTIVHRLYHYLQYLTMWSLQAVSLRSTMRRLRGLEASGISP